MCSSLPQCERVIFLAGPEIWVTSGAEEIFRYILVNEENYTELFHVNETSFVGAFERDNDQDDLDTDDFKALITQLHQNFEIKLE